MKWHFLSKLRTRFLSSHLFITLPNRVSILWKDISATYSCLLVGGSAMINVSRNISTSIVFDFGFLIITSSLLILDDSALLLLWLLSYMLHITLLLVDIFLIISFIFLSQEYFGNNQPTSIVMRFGYTLSSILYFVGHCIHCSCGWLLNLINYVFPKNCSDI